MSQTPVHILMTGAGAPGAPGILKCLQASPIMHITMADANPNALGRWLHAEFVKIPMAEDPQFAEQLLGICRERNIHVLLPLVTKELLPLARKRPEFEAAGVKLLVSDAASIEIANNKSRLYEFLEWRGVEVPRYRVVENLEQFIDAVTGLDFPVNPVCFKPSVSNGSRGFRVIDDKILKKDLLFNKKPDSTYMHFDEAVAILGGGFPELLVSEWLPGEEYSVDCLADRGEPVLIIPRLRKRILNGITVEGEFRKEEEIIAYCSRIVRELSLHGNIGMQVKASGKGKFLILEINPRVQGTIIAALGAGLNLPVLAVKRELGIPIQSVEYEINWGTKFSRYWTEVFY